MAQEIRVLCCYKCKMFQADIVKKRNKKWQCKICQEKQSIFKEFFRGSGAECRLKAQEFNLSSCVQKIDIENEFVNASKLHIDQKSITNMEIKKEKCQIQCKTEETKWAQYVDSFQERLSQNVSIDSSNNLNRKSKPKSKAAQLHSSKIPKSDYSKWDAYL